MHHQPELDFLASLHEVLCWSYPCHMCFFWKFLSATMSGLSSLLIVSVPGVMGASRGKKAPGPQPGHKEWQAALTGRTPGFVCSENTKELHSGMAPRRKHTVLR